MYNKYLEAFIKSADYGSISKAAELLYISPTAVMKQINQLESHLDIKLFFRTNKGLVLTEAGKSLYGDAKYIMQYSKDSIERAHRVLENNQYHIRIGTSLMNPSEKIADLLYNISSKDKSFQFQIIPFDDYRDSYAKTIQHLGEHIDIIAGIYGFSSWTEKHHNTLHLNDVEVCIAVSKNHRLAHKEIVNIEDLYNESIFITEPGDSKYLDKIRNDLAYNHPLIKLINTKTFDLTIFNQIQNSNNILITTKSWASLHPMLKVINVNWDYKVPYGIIYPLNPSKGTIRFINLIKETKK